MSKLDKWMLRILGVIAAASMMWASFLAARLADIAIAWEFGLK